MLAILLVFNFFKYKTLSQQDCLPSGWEIALCLGATAQGLNFSSKVHVTWGQLLISSHLKW